MAMVPNKNFAKLKIQINNLEALERLIGGDTELEFEIRSSIVSAFVKKHLRGIADEALVSSAAIALRKQITDKYFIHNSNYWNNNVILSENGKAALQDQFNLMIVKAVEAAYNESEPVKTINETLLRVANNISAQLEETILSNKITELVDQRIKNILSSTK